jgi:FKBP-type peptidyl-prolyl cis-trans isomerase
MKFRHISFFVAGLLSFGAMAQVNPPTPPAPASPPSVPARGSAGPPASTPPPAASPAIPPATNAAPAEPPGKAQLSHTLGIYYAQGITNNMVGTWGLDIKTDLDMGQFLESFSNVVANVAMPMNVEDLRKVLNQQAAYHKERMDVETKKLTDAGPENKAKGDKFMETIAATPGVTKMASGVAYKVIKEGDGAKPLAVDAVTITFHLSLIDNTEVALVEHVSARVSDPGLLPGIRDVLPLMKTGSHWMVYLPYTQAFGEKPGINDPKHAFKVGPYSAVIVDLELESVQPRPVMPPGMSPPPGLMPPSSGPTATPPATTSSIVRVPSAAEMARGDKPRQMTDAEVEAAKLEELKKAQTNSPAPTPPK